MSLEASAAAVVSMRVGTVAVVSGVRDSLVSDLVPGGVLRAAINLGNPVLAQGTPAAPAGVTVDIAHVPVTSDPHRLVGLCRYGVDAAFMLLLLHECGIHTNRVWHPHQ
jgi:hypothetical protein